MKKSVSHLEFKNLFELEVKNSFSKEKANEIFSQIIWDDLLYKPGCSNLTKLYDFSIFIMILNHLLGNKFVDDAKSYSQLILNGEFPENFNTTFYSWNSKTRQVFLNFILERLLESNQHNENYKKMYFNLKDKLHLDSGNNAEITNIWFQIGLKLKQSSSVDPCAHFLGSIGRIRYTKPLYNDLVNYDKNKAREIFNCHR